MKIYDLVERNSRPVQAPAVVEYAPLSRVEALEAKLDALEAKETPKPAARKTAQKEDTK